MKIFEKDCILLFLKIDLYRDPKTGELRTIWILGSPWRLLQQTPHMFSRTNHTHKPFGTKNIQQLTYNLGGFV